MNIKEIMIKILPEWMRESNRYKHFYYAIPMGFIFTILAVFGCASGMEYKDKEYDNEWDWEDWSATMLGGIIGQVLQIIVWLLIK